MNDSRNPFGDCMGCVYGGGGRGGMATKLVCNSPMNCILCSMSIVPADISNRLSVSTASSTDCGISLSSNSGPRGGMCKLFGLLWNSLSWRWGWPWLPKWSLYTLLVRTASACTACCIPCLLSFLRSFMASLF